MINIISPPGPLMTGPRIYIEAPLRGKRDLFLDFLTRNTQFHMPWVYHSSDPKYYDQYLQRIKRGATQGCFVIDIESKNLVGVININNILLGDIRSASLGYYGDQAYAGSGYMTEGMGLVLRYAVEKIGLHRLEANIQPENMASKRLVQKLGFRQEGFSPKYLKIGGRWCDHERWTILDEEIMKLSMTI